MISKKGIKRLDELEKEYRNLVKPLCLKSDEITPDDWAVAMVERTMSLLKAMTSEKLANWHGCILDSDENDKI